MFDVFWGGHFRRFGIACCCILPEVFESVGVSGRTRVGSGTHTRLLLSFPDMIEVSRTP